VPVPAGIIDQLGIVMVLDPIVPDEQHPPLLDISDHDPQR
jgi:hypothetical protein